MPSRILENKNLNNGQFLNVLFGICGLKNKIYYMCSVVLIQWLNNKVAGLFVLHKSRSDECHIGFLSAI